jgi:MinD-like ATPase involved in chromosome partitioning or flagellar assembly
MTGPQPRVQAPPGPPTGPQPRIQPPAEPRPPRRHRYREDSDDAAPDLVALTPTPPDGVPADPALGRRARRIAEEAAAEQTPAATTAPAPEAPPATEPPAPSVALPEPAAQAPRPDPGPPRAVSRQGWRRWVHSLTRINPGLSRDEKYELNLHARVRRNPRGAYEIGVLGLKGGAGKTSLTVSLGSTFAAVRSDRILALDADPGAGNLADRAGLRPGASIANLLADRQLSAYNDIRAHTSLNAVNLEVLPAEEYGAARRGLSGDDWRFTSGAVSKFYNLVLADCGAGFFDPVTRGVLSTVSGVVIVASASIDGARQALVALEWLHNNGHQDLLDRACVVINHVVPGEPNVGVRELMRQFEQRVQPGRVVVLPWDKHIAAGAEIQLDQLDAVYRRRVLELAAALSDDFERAGRR